MIEIGVAVVVDTGEVTASPPTGPSIPPGADVDASGQPDVDASGQPDVDNT